FLLRGLALDTHLLSPAQRRDGPGTDAAGQKGAVQFILQVIVPAQRLFFGGVGVHQYLVLDALFPAFVQLGFGHKRVAGQLTDRRSERRAGMALPPWPAAVPPRGFGPVCGRCSGSCECGRRSALLGACENSPRSSAAL